jgi:hypothetical protein
VAVAPLAPEPSGAGAILARVGNTVQARLVALEAPDDVVEAAPAAPVPLPALELPRARRPGWPTLAALAVACGLAAVALGAGALVAELRSAPVDESGTGLERALAVVADSGSQRFPLRGSVGRITLVVTDAGRAVLALDGLGRAPAGSVYRAWIVEPGSAAPTPAGSFDGSVRLVPLAGHVARGARVGVTLEPEVGGDRPSRPLRLVAVRP